jgi:hypothetical protein
MTNIRRLIFSLMLPALALPLMVAAPASASTPAAAPAQGHPICFVITQADSGKTFTTGIPSCDVLELDNGLHWSEPAVSSDAISLKPLFSPIGVQSWDIVANHPGKATITAFGRPVCLPDQVCPLFIVRFQVTIIVVR